MLRSIWNYLTYVFRPVKGDIAPLNAPRALGIFAVMTGHLAQTLEHHDRILNFSPYWKNIYDNASQFMDLFFVLSGFLIAGPLIARLEAAKPFRFGEYFVKRTFRIFPAFYIFITLYAFVLFPAVAHKTGMENAAQEISDTQFRALFEYLYLSNYFQGIQYHTWSLALEEQFYLTIPFFLAFVYIRMPQGRRTPLLIFLYFLPLIYRIWAHFTVMTEVPSSGQEMVDAYHKYIYHPFHGHADSLIMGVIIGRLHVTRAADLEAFFGRKRLNAVILSVTTVCIVCMTLLINEFEYGFLNQVIRFNVFNLYYAYFLLLLVYRPDFWLSKLFSWKIYSAPAKLTYTTYILHVVGSLPVTAALIGLKGYVKHEHVFFYGLASGAFVMLLAYFYYLVAERPFMILRDVIVSRMKGKPMPHLQPPP
ncbi:MAG: acyltransferase [Leptospiraceae bacterium]|nr:acyltransferase [Leptospiraceae bacterium]